MHIFDTPERRENADNYTVLDTEPINLSDEFNSADNPCVIEMNDGRQATFFTVFDYDRDYIFCNIDCQNKRIESIEGEIACIKAVKYKDGALLVYNICSGEKWELYSVEIDGNIKAKNRNKITSGNFNANSPDLCQSISGAQLVYLTYHELHLTVFHSVYNGKWETPKAVSDGSANCFLPCVKTFQNEISICYDTYKYGSYDVVLKQNFGNEIRIAASPFFEANASIDYDKSGNLFIAFEERQENWGKDKGYANSLIPSEYQSLVGYSRVRVVIYSKDKKLLQINQPTEMYTKGYSWGGDRAPIIRATEDGGIWLAFKRPDVKFLKVGTFERLIPVGAYKNYAVYFNGFIWTERISFGDFHSRIDSAVSALVNRNSEFVCTYHSDFSVPDKGGFFMQKKPQKDSVLFVSFPSIKEVKKLVCGPLTNRVSRNFIEGAKTEKSEVDKLRSYRRGDIRLLRGDLHRHTEYSWDGCSDGSFLDFIRYSIDAASLDFVCATDHNQWKGRDERYNLWRADKLSDTFNAPGIFTTFFGYELGSLKRGLAHRCVINTKKYVEPEKPFEKEQLYDYLRRTGSIAIPHSTGTQIHAPENWDGCNTDLEPVCEIYQGCRMSSEYYGAPLAGCTVQNLDDGCAKNNAGTLWDAWQKGYKIGVISTSDHQATHCSFAHVMAKENTREAIYDGLKKRHTAGATDAFIIDVYSQSHEMGDECEKESFTIAVYAFEPLCEISIIDNFNIISIPAKNGMFTYFPNDENGFFYVRAVTQNTQVAWSSPIFYRNT